MFKSERSFQHEPFLGKYNHHDVDDEEDLAKAEARHYRHVQPTGRNYLPYLVLVFVTSFFWAGLFYLFHPDERACLHHSSPAGNFDDHNNNNPLPNPHPNSGGFTATIPIATSPEISTTHPDDHPTTTTTTTTITPPLLNITSHATLLTCGASVPEARARGCRYDLLLNNWVPAPCYAQEFVDEYADENNYSDSPGSNWGGFADEALTQPLTRHQMAEAPFYWTSLRDHIVHCAVLWKKQFATMYEFEARGVLDTVLASAGHTDHCAQYLMDFGMRNWTGPTKTEMGFAGCWVKNAK